MQEVGIKEVLEQLSGRLNRIEDDIRGKADRWETRIWFMTIMVFLTAILGVILAKGG